MEQGYIHRINGSARPNIQQPFSAPKSRSASRWAGTTGHDRVVDDDVRKRLRTGPSALRATEAGNASGISDNIPSRECASKPDVGSQLARQFRGAIYYSMKHAGDGIRAGKICRQRKSGQSVRIRVKKIPRPGVHSLGQKRPEPGDKFGVLHWRLCRRG
jgi:hypothetical protein